MNYYDTRFNVMEKENSVNELRYLCNVDNISRNICSRRAFWLNKFNEQGLYLPDYIPTTSEEWLVEYEKELIIKNKIDKILYILENNPGGKNVALFTNSDIRFNQIKINGIDTESLIYEYNKWLILKSKNRYTFPEPDCVITVREKGYYLVFNYYRNTINDGVYISEYPISKSIIIDLLHLLFNYNVKLRDINYNFIDV